jgi:poly(3-hydroxyalkanoate) synthetase
MSRAPFYFGPWSMAAAAQSNALRLWLTGPVRRRAEEAVLKGEDPDVFAVSNADVEAAYAALIRSLCERFMSGGRFDRSKMNRAVTTPSGRDFLRNAMLEAARLEYRYHARGMTRLGAMKELLKSLLIVVTETPTEKTPLPFAPKGGNGHQNGFREYLEENRARLENLYAEDAFDVVAFSERATGGHIGYSAYSIVPDSRLHCVSLRHYPPPAGVEPNGRALYLATPLINRPEIFDLAEGKSIIEGMHREGYQVYLVDHGQPGYEERGLGLDFFVKKVHDRYLDLIKERHPESEIQIMGYCMGGTLMLPYLARRAEERRAKGESMDIRKVALMTAPVKFDDGDSGHGPMRRVIEKNYDPLVMEKLFGNVNIPPHTIDAGMNEIQPGVRHTVTLGFYGRAARPGAIADAAPFLYWLTHGTRFPVRAHREWIERVFMGNEIYREEFALPSELPELDGKPVDMDALAYPPNCTAFFDYRGERDPIAPPRSCVAGETWGLVGRGNCTQLSSCLNRTIEKNVGHIFVVSKKYLAEYLENVSAFFRDEDGGTKS